MMNTILPHALAWMFLLAGYASAQDATAFPKASPESVGLTTSAVNTIRDAVAVYAKNGTIVGGELLIIKDRKTVLHEVFGDRDREDKKPMERNTIFNIRSMTKSLTGTAMQMLIDEGKVQLSDPVAKYLSGFDNDKSRMITIEQLLEHRSGLPLTVITTAINQYPDLQAQAKAAGEKGPEFKPGEKFWYSDAGSDCAAAVVEKISGMTIDCFITERILQPVGMVDSFYPTKADDPRKARLASLYLGQAGKWNRFWKPGGAPMYPFAWGSQTLYSTPVDYARFLAMWMDGGKANGKQLLSREAMKRILTPASPMSMLGSDAAFPTYFVGLKAFYGQMSVLYAKGDKPQNAKVVVFGHSGSDGTIGWAIPEKDLIICYFTQSRGQTSVLRLEQVISREIFQAGQSAAHVPAELKPYLGTYYANFGQFKNEPFEVVFQNGHLAVDIPSQLVFELKDPDKDGRWVFAMTDKISIGFKKDAAGKVVSMNIKQSGMTFELPNQPVKLKAMKKETVEKYLGKYERQEDKGMVEVYYKDGALYVRALDTGTELELSPNDDKKSWKIVINPSISLLFVEENGKATSFTFTTPDGKKFVRKRVDK